MPGGRSAPRPNTVADVTHALALLTSLHHEVFGPSWPLMAATMAASLAALIAVVVWAVRSHPGES